MRCLSCNVVLTDFESTRKYESGEFIDMCNHCFGKSDLKYIATDDREDLGEEEIDIEDLGDD